MDVQKAHKTLSTWPLRLGPVLPMGLLQAQRQALPLLVWERRRYPQTDHQHPITDWLLTLRERTHFSSKELASTSNL